MGSRPYPPSNNNHGNHLNVKCNKVAARNNADCIAATSFSLMEQ